MLQFLSAIFSVRCCLSEKLGVIIDFSFCLFVYLVCVCVWLSVYAVGIGDCVNVICCCHFNSMRLLLFCKSAMKQIKLDEIRVKAFSLQTTLRPCDRLHSLARLPVPHNYFTIFASNKRILLFIVRLSIETNVNLASLTVLQALSIFQSIKLNSLSQLILLWFVCSTHCSFVRFYTLQS